MERRKFLKVTGGVLATLPFVDLSSLALPAVVDKQIAMLPDTLPYWNVFVTANSWPQSSCATKEQVAVLIKEFAPSEGRSSGEWVTYWFRNKIGADRFRAMLKDKRINSWKPEQRIAMDKFTKEQWEYWHNSLRDCNVETYYYRKLMVMDEEQVSITEDAEYLGKDAFCDQFQDRNIGEEMWNEVSKDNFNNYIDYDKGDYFMKKLEPRIEGGVLQKVSFGAWEDFLYFEDNYEAWKNDDMYHDELTPAIIRKNWR
jgi:hypothetical protein